MELTNSRRHLYFMRCRIHSLLGVVDISTTFPFYYARVDILPGMSIAPKGLFSDRDKIGGHMIILTNTGRWSNGKNTKPKGVHHFD